MVHTSIVEKDMCVSKQEKHGSSILLHPVMQHVSLKKDANAGLNQIEPIGTVVHTDKIKVDNNVN
jgi:hypothetical protein